MASVTFVPLPVPAMTALLDGDVATAGTLAGTELSPYFASDRAKSLWRRRVDQIADVPSDERWVARAAIDDETGYAVGYAGFHGAPDAAGMVEVGYTVVPERRRQGYARLMLAALIERARNEPGVRTFRVTISPDNEASLATIKPFGFAHVGEQMDEEDGLELIFEVVLA